MGIYRCVKNFESIQKIRGELTRLISLAYYLNHDLENNEVKICIFYRTRSRSQSN